MRRAGFPEASIHQGVAISLAELGTGSDTEKVFGDNGESVGVWQIHLVAHKDVTSACAMDLDCSTKAAYRISNGGTNWNPWGAFTSGAFRKYLGWSEQPSTTRPTQDGSGNTLDPGPISAGTAPTGDGSSPLTSFQFPQLQLGPFSFSSDVLFKIALTFVALGLVFVAILKLTGIDPVPSEIRASPDPRT